MQAETVDKVYQQFITRKDSRCLYRGRLITACEPVFNGSLYRIYFTETESIVVASTAVCTVEHSYQKGRNHA